MKIVRKITSSDRGAAGVVDAEEVVDTAEWSAKQLHPSGQGPNEAGLGLCYTKLDAVREWMSTSEREHSNLGVRDDSILILRTDRAEHFVDELGNGHHVCFDKASRGDGRCAKADA